MQELLTVGEIMEQCKVSKSTVYEWRRSAGFPPVFKFGKSIRIPADEFEAWLETHREAKEERHVRKRPYTQLVH